MAKLYSLLLVNTICTLRYVSEHRRTPDDVVNTIFSQPPAILESLARYRASILPIAFSQKLGTY
jgi:hypothetical protein